MKPNPTNKGSYNFDRGFLLKQAYMLLCLFFADKEISRHSDPTDKDAVFTSLKNRFFETEVTKLLMELATLVRVLHDQMEKRPDSDPYKIKYVKQREATSKLEYGLFDSLNLDLRKICNKIIHSEVFELHSSEGAEAHESDSAFKYGMDEKAINWTHLNNYVRLSGKFQKVDWYVLLDIRIFVIGIYVLLDD
jgi:hypothetical protein